MSEKKAKQVRKEGREVVVEYTIRAFADHSVQIIGPLHNFLMFREVMNRAEMAAIKSIVESENSRIIKPEPGLQIIN